MIISGMIIYECGICGEHHPWEFKGDCRDDDNRVQPDTYANSMGCSENDLVIRTMDERVAADDLGE